MVVSQRPAAHRDIETPAAPSPVEVVKESLFPSRPVALPLLLFFVDERR